MRKPSIAIIVVTLVGLTALTARGHSPDPTFSGPLWEQNQLVKYSWKSGQVPPSWMKPAIHAAADDSNDTRYSKAARFDYESGASSKVSYGEPSGCGPGGIACMARTAPTKFKVAFRKHGYVFDWGTLRWCQKNSNSGCYDVENIMLDELGHVEILQHHVNYSSNSDYGQAVVQTISRAKPKSGWNKHSYGRCDVATLQKKYDVKSWTAGYSQCLDLDTDMTLSKTIANGQATFTAKITVEDHASYGRLKKNPVAGRHVILQKKLSGTSTWSSAGTMTPSPGETYKLTIPVPSSTTNYRARFATPDDEGLNGSTSPWVTLGG